jgi:hypothetical protein
VTAGLWLFQRPATPSDNSSVRNFQTLKRQPKGCLFLFTGILWKIIPAWRQGLLILVP